jgi:uncharacterized protein (TIGR02145 family)
MKHFILCINLMIAAISCRDLYEPAQVRIEGVNYLTHSSAIIKSNVTDDGNAFVMVKGVCWSTRPLPTIADNQSDKGMQDVGIYICPLYGLHPNTTYYVRAFAKNVAGVSYSKETMLITPTPEYLVDQRDMHKYAIVRIGNQHWMAQNLDFYLKDGSHYYKNDSVSYSKFGRLYNWEKAKIACPEGWSLPSNEDWQILVKYLGMPDSQASQFGCQGFMEAGKLKEPGTGNWIEEPDTVTNETGFTAIPCGTYWAETNSFSDMRVNAIYWSSSSISETAGSCEKIEAFNNKICNVSGNKSAGFSVRCIKK